MSAYFNGIVDPVADKPDNSTAAEQQRTLPTLVNGYFLVGKVFFDGLCTGYPEGGKPVPGLNAADNQRKPHTVQVEKCQESAGSFKVRQFTGLYFGQFDGCIRFLDKYKARTADRILKNSRLLAFRSVIPLEALFANIRND